MKKVRGLNRAAAGEPLPLIQYLREAADQVDRAMSMDEHSGAISRWGTVMARTAGLDETTVWCVDQAGRLHDVGKIMVPEAILAKRENLTDDEWSMLRQHPDHGFRLARVIPGYAAVADSIRAHHERFDGQGYPDRLRGENIRIEARIIAVCDSWAAMRANRAYQPALSEDRAREQLAGGRGGQFDPDLVDLFLDLHDQGTVGDLGRLPAVYPTPAVA
jgi:HD-GYP domain-containing protein (c-di-GMP phosphodiesterase class II)